MRCWHVTCSCHQTCYSLPHLFRAYPTKSSQVQYYTHWLAKQWAIYVFYWTRATSLSWKNQLILLTLWTISLFDWFTVLFWDSKHVIYMDISSFFQISWKKTLISIVFCLCITYIRCIHRFAQSLLPLSAGASCKSWALMSLGPLPKWLAAFAELHQCQYDCIKGSVLYIIPWLWSTRPGYCVNLQVSHSFLKLPSFIWWTDVLTATASHRGEQHLIGPPGGRFTERGRVHGMPCLVIRSVW